MSEWPKTIRTTMRPHDDLVVGEQEYTDLDRAGVILRPPVERVATGPGAEGDTTPVDAPAAPAEASTGRAEPENAYAEDGFAKRDPADQGDGPAAVEANTEPVDEQPTQEPAGQPTDDQPEPEQAPAKKTTKSRKAASEGDTQ